MTTHGFDAGIVKRWLAMTWLAGGGDVESRLPSDFLSPLADHTWGLLAESNQAKGLQDAETLRPRLWRYIP